MIQAIFNAQTVYVLNDPWNGNSNFAMDVSVVRDTETGLTRRDSRRPYSATLRVPKLKYDATVTDGNLRSLKASLRALTTEQIILPLWPAITRWADRATAPISGGLKIAWKSDWSQYEIYTSVEPVWPGPDDNFAPALMGFLTANSQASFINPDAEGWKIEFLESSPAAYALQPIAFAASAGPQPAGYASAPLLMPFAPDFSQIGEQIGVEISRSKIGFSRQQAQTFYPQVAELSQSAQYTLNQSKAGQLLRFFQDVAAPGASFWAPGWLECARLTQDALAGNSVLTVESTAAVAVGDYIWIYDISGATARKITVKTVNTITLDSAVGALSTIDTLIFPLALARMDKPLISLSWTCPDSVSFALAWTSVTPEMSIPGDETLGVTIGLLPARVILFHFYRDFLNGTVTHWYFTSYETDLAYNAHTWSSEIIECGDISRGLNLEDDGVDITADNFTGNPLSDEVAKRAEVPLNVEIFVGELSGGTVQNVTTAFTGFVSSPSKTGNTIKATCKFGPRVLDSQLPFFIKGSICNNLRGNNSDGSFLISPGCTLLRSDWKFTATVASPNSAVWPFTLHFEGLARVTGPAPTFFANWFAGGVIEWGTGANIQRRYIASSTNPSGGNFAVNLHRYFNGVPLIGDDVVLYPGCDGTFATCQAYDVSSNPTGRFNNKDNFFALPFMPTANPSLTGQPNLGTQGAKK